MIELFCPHHGIPALLYTLLASPLPISVFGALVWSKVSSFMAHRRARNDQRAASQGNHVVAHRDCL